MQRVEEHNAKGLSWKLGENQFSDLNQEQFRAAGGLGWIPDMTKLSVPILGEHEYNGEPMADSVDWRTQGAVNPVKDQGQCGSCWAFGTNGGVEGAWQIATGSLVSLAEQQLLDCSTQNLGCQGGNAALAINYMTSENIASEASYPYTAVQGTCRSGVTAIPAGGVAGYHRVGWIFGASVDAMKSAVQQQPVTIAIEADQYAFQAYKSGVLSSGCGTQLDHAVLTVGYGTEDGQDYWLVRNSWGGNWGDDGYIKIAQAGNQCGVTSQPVYPQVSGSVTV